MCSTNKKTKKMRARYVGEVIDTAEFERRRDLYHMRGDKHFYLMELSADAMIDATEKAGETCLNTVVWVNVLRCRCCVHTRRFLHCCAFVGRKETGRRVSGQIDNTRTYV
jgi:hypothetical protein